MSVPVCHCRTMAKVSSKCSCNGKCSYRTHTLFWSQFVEPKMANGEKKKKVCRLQTAERRFTVCSLLTMTTVACLSAVLPLKLSFFISFFSLLLNCFVSGLDGGKKAEEGQPFSTLGSSHRCCRWRQRHAVVKSGLHRSTHRHRLTPFPTGRKLAQYFIKWVSRLFTATYTWHTIQLLAQPRDLRAQPNCRCCCLKGCRLEFN